MKKAFYVPNRPWIVDDVRVRDDGVEVSEIHGLTLEEIQAKYPGALIMSREAAMDAIVALCKTVPQQIDLVDYCYARQVFKHYDRKRNGDTESFKLTKDLNERVTVIYAKVGSTYWTFRDVMEMSHDDIAERVRYTLTINSQQQEKVA